MTQDDVERLKERMRDANAAILRSKSQTLKRDLRKFIERCERKLARAGY